MNIFCLFEKSAYLCQKLSLTNQNKITPVKSLLDLRKEFNQEIEHFLSKNRFSTNLALYSKDLDYDGTRARYKAVFIDRYTKEHIILIKEYHA